VAMTETYAPAYDTWQRRSSEAKQEAIANLVELVEPGVGGTARVIRDPVTWVHVQFDLYRSAMPDNDPRLPALAKIEFDFVAALCAFSIGESQRQRSTASPDP
jgi:hypothetical protein